MMKYEPTNKAGTSEYELLMQPFVYDDPETYEPDWELLEIVSETLEQMSPQDRDIIAGVYYMRMTFEELADHIGTRAKSHAWRKHRQTLDRFKEALTTNPRYVEHIRRHNDNL